ncbi:DUF4262 domain-containing protein [Xanthomonas phage X1]|nr:DUF4262 domain-containing protein [Xanthomonas phage X1]
MNEMLAIELAVKIELNGYTMVGVFDPEDKDPGFVYTVGLTERGWPEVIMVGNIHPMIAEKLITDLISGWQKKEKFVMGDNEGLLVFRDGTEHAIRVVEADTGKALEEYATAVGIFYSDMPVGFVQALIPDRFGRFPDDPEYDQSKQAQPIIK